jgi:competence protein ComEA
MELNRNQQLAAIAIIGLALIGISFGLLRPSLGHQDTSGIKVTESGVSGEQATGDVDVSVDGNPAQEPAPTTGASIMVHVAGRVRVPNVYRIPPGSRVVDAIKAAGGSMPDANLDAINLAARVKDGDKVLIPARTMAGPSVVFVAPSGSSQSSASPSSPPSPAASGASSTPSAGKLTAPGQGTVNINSADATELQRLPGVGPSTAQKIIEHRTQIGSFSSVDQLLDVKGLGPKKLDKIRPFVAL